MPVKNWHVTCIKFKNRVNRLKSDSKAAKIFRLRTEIENG